MLTIFSTPKPFRDHIAVIQRNAIRSILFGDEAGAAENARELGIRHEPEVERNEHGTKYLRSIFARAQELARYDRLCYVNCDIVLLSDFRSAIERVVQNRPFLMIGQRWDVEVHAPIEFGDPRWEDEITQLARRTNRQRPPQWIDYFVFSRGLYGDSIPPFVIGRPGWDNWLVWFAGGSGARVVDASRVVTAVHQNHDYSHHPDGETGVWQGEEAQRNYALLEKGRRYATMADATHLLEPAGLRRNWSRWLVMGKRRAVGVLSRIWFGLLRATRPVRHRIGLRQETIARMFAKNH